MQASNLMWLCPACSKPSRTGARYSDDGSKERYCKQCGKSAGMISPPRQAYAKK